MNYNKHIRDIYDKKNISIDEIEICEECTIKIANFLDSLKKS